MRGFAACGGDPLGGAAPQTPRDIVGQKKGRELVL